MNDTTKRHPRTLSGCDSAFRDAAYADPVRHHRRATFGVWLLTIVRRLIANTNPQRPAKARQLNHCVKD
jgi:hypothetical protein